MFTKAITALVLCGTFASKAMSHMVITSPVPYGQDSLTNSPLENDGSDFPCKQRPGVYDISSMNQIPVGRTQSLAFKGGATHGGGSCQLSVTLDKQPTKNSQWKVVYSIIGGCPSNTTGNLSDDSDGTDATVFSYSLDKRMPSGTYTLAWTWFNKIGNREMYMNCAPITVTGGASNNDYLDSLPDMFVINIPNEDCATVEGEDFQFPSPGDSATTPVRTALGSKTVGSNCAAVTNKGAGSGSAAAATGSPPSAAGSSAAGESTTAAASAHTQAATSAPSSPASGNAPVTVTTLATVTGTAAASAGPDNATQPAAGGAPSAAASGSSAGAGSGSSSGGACSNNGAIVCNGPSQFGLCNGGSIVWQEVADGTTCSNGRIARKRSIRHARRHIAGRIHF